MKVNEYIYRNWANWNFAILKQLCEDEGIEWSEELVGYLKNSPGNTNWNLLVDFGIEPYGSGEEDESEGDYKLYYWTGQGYPINKSTSERTSVVTVSSPSKILGKKYDIYYWQNTDIETGEGYYALSGDESEYFGSFRVNTFDTESSWAQTHDDDNRTYTCYNCDYSEDHGENWSSNEGAVCISEPYDDENSKDGVMHYNGIIEFYIQDTQVETGD